MEAYISGNCLWHICLMRDRSASRVDDASDRCDHNLRDGARVTQVALMTNTTEKTESAIFSSPIYPRVPMVSIN